MTPLAKLKAFRASFRFKLFIIFTALTALIALLFSSLYLVNEIRAQRKQAVEKAHMLALNLAESIRLPLYAENREVLRQLAEDMGRYPEIHEVVISTGDGRVLADYRHTAVPLHAGLLSETVEVRSHPLGAAPDMAIIGDLNRPGAMLGRVRLDLDTSSLKQRINQIVVTSCALAVFFWIAVSSLCYLALRQVTRSFKALMAGIETVRSGDYSCRIEVVSNDEPGRAAAKVNELAATLQERDAENRRLQEELVKAMRLEIQEEKKVLMAKLIQANRMTSLGLLASSMAHEINTPNGAIKLAGQQLGKTWKDTLPILDRLAVEEGDFVLGGVVYSLARDGITRATDVISRCSERIEKVIQDLRAYNLGDHEVVDTLLVNQAVSEALVIVKSRGYRSDIEITNDLQPDLPMVLGNSHQLGQVVINLVLNAIQAIPDGHGGVVHVQTCYDGTAEEVCISVKDNGEGIPPEMLTSLTEPFVSTRLEKGGSGLGLYISSFIVQEHGGRLEFASKSGEGTAVTIRIPARTGGTA